MKQTVNLPGGSFSIYTSPRHLPETRRIEFECYRLIQDGIGSGMADIDKHFAGVFALLNGRKYEEIETALNNLRYLLYGITYKQITPRSLALACLVDSVNGEPANDLSETALMALVRRLSDMGITDLIVTRLFEDAKESIYKELKIAFPGHFEDSSEIATQLLTDALLLQMDRFTDPDDPSLDFRLKQLSQGIAETAKPLSFREGTSDYVIDLIKKAHRMRKVSLMREQMPVDDNTPSYSFWEYYTTLEELLNQTSADDKSN